MPADNKPYVVLLHGLGRTSLSMAIPRRRLLAAGFDAFGIHYPSRHKPIEELAQDVAAELRERITEPGRTVHFLTHSMGGIVLRVMLAADPPPVRLGGVVMLAPPNRGSGLARAVSVHPLFRTTLGPAAEQLRAGPESLPNRLGPLDAAVGVIAGSRATSPWSFLLDDESDGTVAIEETKLEGMTDFLVVPRGHTFIMNDPAVIDQAIHFFRHGRFDHETPSTER